MTLPLLYSGPTAEDLAQIPAALKTLPQWVLFLLLEVPNASGEFGCSGVTPGHKAMTRWRGGP